MFLVCINTIKYEICVHSIHANQCKHIRQRRWSAEHEKIFMCGWTIRKTYLKIAKTVTLLIRRSLWMCVCDWHCEAVAGSRFFSPFIFVFLLFLSFGAVIKKKYNHKHNTNVVYFIHEKTGLFWLYIYVYLHLACLVRSRIDASCDHRRREFDDCLCIK